MKILLGVLLLLNLALYLVLGPYDVPAKLLPGGLDEHAGSGLTLVTEADPAQLEVARSGPARGGAKLDSCDRHQGLFGGWAHRRDHRAARTGPGDVHAARSCGDLL
jgi:hypothetical protein